MSRYNQVEQQNNSRFDELANKLSTFRAINQETQNIAQQDSTLIDSIHDNMSTLFQNIKSTSVNLTRSMQSGNSVWRYVGIALLLFFIVYTLLKVF